MTFHNSWQMNSFRLDREIFPMTAMVIADERNFMKLFAINDEEEVFAINDEEDGHSLHLVLKFETIVHVLDFA